MREKENVVIRIRSWGVSVCVCERENVVISIRGWGVSEFGE